MELIQIEHENNIAIVKLNRGVTNAINLQLVNKLAEHLQNIKKDPAVHSLVLSSSNEKFFSIGLDVPELFDLSKEDFMHFYKRFNQLCLSLYALPKLTIAAITGHAIAGGCILALCCDYRFIAKGKKLMGLNEIKLAVPVPYPADCILRDLVGTRNARNIMYYAEFYPPEELLQLGVIDQVLPLEEVLPKSIEKAKSMDALPQEAFEIIKHNRIEKVEEQILKHLGEKEELFVDCWYSDEGRRRLKEAIEKF